MVMVLGLGTGIADQLRGFADVIFLGGLHLDARGRCNPAVLGGYARPRRRGPGSIVLSLVATVKRTFLFFERHDPRVFGDSVDFVSGERQTDDELLVVTPLAVFGSRGGCAQVVLKSMHPGVDFDTVQAHARRNWPPYTAARTGGNRR
jgi:glutaconate CoA-transferase subunit B